MEHDLNLIWEAYVAGLKPNNVSFKKMAEIEKEYFPQIWGGSSEAYIMDDVKDDMEQPGFYGYALFDDDTNEIYGYAYGYSLTEDELLSDTGITDVSDLDQITFYDKQIEGQVKSMSDPRELLDIFNERNSFYVSNFVIENTHKGQGGRMAKKLIDGLKDKGIKYIVFDALEDTRNLFIRNGKFVPRLGINKVIARGDTIFVVDIT